jgi:hypothetical protein
MKRFLEKFKEVLLLGNKEVWLKKLQAVLKKKDYLIFFIFLMISTGFWFLNALRDDYFTTFSYPVRFVNSPENETIVETSDTSVKLRVRANGFAILRQYVGNRFLPVNYDVSQMRRVTKDGMNYAYLLSRDQKNMVLDQLFLGMDLVDMQPDTIFLKLEKVIEKDVPIILNGEIGYEKQFMPSGPVVFRPDIVTVSGPVSIIDTLHAVYTQFLTIDRLRDTLQRSIKLQHIKDISINRTDVIITFPVEPFSEKTLQIPLEVMGLPDSLWLKTFPSEIELTFRAGLSRFERISPSDFRAVVDAEIALGEGRPPRLRVRMEKVPENIQSVDFTPLFVEYLIEKRR